MENYTLPPDHILSHDYVARVNKMLRINYPDKLQETIKALKFAAAKLELTIPENEK